jgi:sigma-E factor negative regulatory protein RseB
MRGLTAAALTLPLALAGHAGDAHVKLDARGWLERVAEAATRTSYQGTMVFTAGSTISTTRVARYCTGRGSFEQLEPLDGPPRMIYRHNQIVHTLWPRKKIAVVQQRDPRTPFPALPESGGDVLAGYEVRLEGADRVAAHPSQVVLLQPRDAQRYAQRLWAEASTGLMLRADVLDHEGRVLESTAFTDLKTGVRPQPDVVTAAMNRLGGYHVIKPEVTRTRLEDEGWQLRSPVAGFKPISCVKRPVGSGGGRDNVPMVVQSVYSDGLAYVSVFVEPHDPQRHKPMMSTWGAVGTLMQSLGDAWVTVVGDVPMDTLERFAAALKPAR